MREGKERAATLTPATPNSEYWRPFFASQRIEGYACTHAKKGPESGAYQARGKTKLVN